MGDGDWRVILREARAQRCATEGSLSPRGSSRSFRGRVTHPRQHQQGNTNANNLNCHEHESLHDAGDSRAPRAHALIRRLFGSPVVWPTKADQPRLGTRHTDLKTTALTTPTIR